MIDPFRINSMYFEVFGHRVEIEFWRETISYEAEKGGEKVQITREYHRVCPFYIRITEKVIDDA